MPILDFKEDKKSYGKVVSTLLNMGCLVEARDKSKLVVTPAQNAELIRLGIVDPERHITEPNQSGNAKTKT